MSDMPRHVVERPVLLALRTLRVALPGAPGALEAVSLTLAPGGSLAVLGERGAGKSLLLAALLGLLPAGAVVTGEARYRGAALRPGQLGWLPQDPARAFDPTRRVGEQLLALLPGPRAARRQALLAALHQAGLALPEQALRCRPGELGAAAQTRLLLGAAFAAEPDLVLCDEPARGLDLSARQEVLAALRRMADAHGTALLVMTHDAAVAAALCEDVAVLYAGRLVEQGPTGNLLADPRHPYSRLLLRCHPDRARDLRGLPGAPPPPALPPPGCRFHPRCPLARPVCARTVPESQRLFDGSLVACPFHAERLADG
jgi:oligopeptide/dipeptide ABC transporter ATP-binding protein